MDQVAQLALLLSLAIVRLTITVEKESEGLVIVVSKDIEKFFLSLEMMMKRVKEPRLRSK